MVVCLGYYSNRKLQYGAFKSPFFHRKQRLAGRSLEGKTQKKHIRTVHYTSPWVREPFAALPCTADRALPGARLGFVEPFLGGGGVALVQAATYAFGHFFDGVSIATSSPSSSSWSTSSVSLTKL